MKFNLLSKYFDLAPTQIEELLLLYLFDRLLLINKIGIIASGNCKYVFLVTKIRIMNNFMFNLQNFQFKQIKSTKTITLTIEIFALQCKMYLKTLFIVLNASIQLNDTYK